MKQNPDTFNSMPALNRGLALPTAMIMLLVIVLVGISSLQITAIEDQMATNTRLQQLAFDAAESTLREGERVAERITDARTLVFYNGVSPDEDLSTPEPGDTCTGGYCTPAEHDEEGPTILDENSHVVQRPGRWQDETIDVWADASKYHVYSLANSYDGLTRPPRYIIEFMGFFIPHDDDGNIDSTCPSTGGVLDGVAADWPFCPTDPKLFRITVLAEAGFDGSQSQVMLQSVLQVP